MVFGHTKTSLVKFINTSLESLAPTFILSLIPTRIPLSHFPTLSVIVTGATSFV